MWIDDRELMSDINPLIAAAGAAALALQSDSDNDSDSDSDNSRVTVTVTVTQATTAWSRILRRTVRSENRNVDEVEPLTGKQH